MQFTRVHVAGGALIVTTAAFWLFFVARLSEDLGVPAREEQAADRGRVPGAVRPPLPDDAIRELRATADRAARGTLLTTSTP